MNKLLQHYTGMFKKFPNYILESKKIVQETKLEEPKNCSAEN